MKYKPGEIYKIKYNGRKVPIYFLKVGEVILPKTKCSYSYTDIGYYNTFPRIRKYSDIFKEDIIKFLPGYNTCETFEPQIVPEYSKSFYFEIVDFDEAKTYKLKRHLLSF
jgi:hypothetical protein